MVHKSLNIQRPCAVVSEPTEVVLAILRWYGGIGHYCHQNALGSIAENLLSSIVTETLHSPNSGIANKQHALH